MTRFFVFSDLHYGDTEDGSRCVAELAARAREQEPDFIISLGDLCPPEEKNRWILRGAGLRQKLCGIFTPQPNK